MPKLLRTFFTLSFLVLLGLNSSKAQTLDTTALLHTKVYVLMNDSTEHIGKFAEQHPNSLIVFTRTGRQQLVRTNVLQLVAYADYFTANGLETSYEAFRKNALYLNIGGSMPLLGLVFERQLHEHFAFELGIGKNESGDHIALGTGLKVTLQGITKRRLPLHFGIQSTFEFDDGPQRLMLYFPVGFSYSSPLNGISFGADIGPKFIVDVDAPVRWGSIKLGLRF
jgi:hypothetical protein